MDTVASGIMRHALDYIKGKDPVNPGMWTREFWGEPEVVVAEEEPGWNTNSNEPKNGA
jgi:hypothetical protein